MTLSEQPTTLIWFSIAILTPVFAASMLVLVGIAREKFATAFSR